MKTLSLILALVLFASPAIASPFLIADPNPAEEAVLWYRITNLTTGETFTTDYGNQHGDGMIVLDFANHDFAPGEVSLEIKALNLEGESVAAPFVFTMPSGVPGSLTNGRLMP